MKWHICVHSCWEGACNNVTEPHGQWIDTLGNSFTLDPLQFVPGSVGVMLPGDITNCLSKCDISGSSEQNTSCLYF
jgi:hypothetical protein